jgi:hypothetical protein
MVTVTVLVEGAGESLALRSIAKKKLGELLKKLPLARQPRIEFQGTRRAAFDRLEIELSKPTKDRVFILLVDSEEPFTESSDPNEKHHRWAHVRNRSEDHWERPDAATDEHLHFMATAMETWIIADKEAIRSRFPKDFRENAIKDIRDWEERSKEEVQDLLRSATGERSWKGCYKKGEISFELLGRVNPQTLRDNCRHANLFFSELEKLLGRKGTT